jgi:hypothetical protein
MENLCGGGGPAAAEKQRLRRKAGAAAGSAWLLPLALTTRCTARNMLLAATAPLLASYLC